MTTGIAGVARRFTVLVAAALSFWVANAAYGQGLGALAHDVRIVRYAATGNPGKILGNDGTPAARQAWLNAIAAALADASGFFYEVGISGMTPSDLAHASHPAHTYTPITLSVTGTGAGGAIIASDIQTELGKVTWIVKTALEYGTHHDDLKYAPHVGGVMAASIAESAVFTPACCLDGIASNSAPPYDHEDRSYGNCKISIAQRGIQGYDPCVYQAFAGARAIKGRFAAPGSGVVSPIKVGGGTAPSATVTGYFLGIHGGTAAPGGFLCGYDAMSMADECTTETTGWPSVTCPTLPETWAEVIDNAGGGIDVDICHARIMKPEIPSCYDNLSGTSCGTCSGASSATTQYGFNSADLCVRASRRPIWANTRHGHPLSVDLAFDDSNPFRQGDFGEGWTWNYDMQVRSQGDMRSVTSGKGRGEWWFIPNGDGTYDGPPSTGYTLVSTGGGWLMTTEDGEQYAFNSSSKLDSVTDRHGDILTFFYDPNGRVQSMTSADNVTLTFARDAQGRVVSITDPEGRSATFSYGKAYPEDGVTRDENCLVSMTDMGGYESVYEYDWNDQIAEGVANTGAITKIRNNVARDAGGTITEADDTTFTRGIAADRQQELAVVDPLGGLTTYRLDYADTGTFTIVDPLGNITSETYEFVGGRHVLTGQIDADENEVSFEYDAIGAPVSATDPGGNVTTRARNEYGRVLTETHPGNAVTTYTYDTNGQDMLTRTEPTGDVTTYTYNAEGQVTSTSRTVDATTTETSTVTYDTDGHVLTRTEPSGRVTTNTYDAQGRIATTTASDRGTMSHTYNSRGLKATVTHPDGAVVTYAYDNLDRVVQKTWSTDNTSQTYSHGCCGVEQTTSRTGVINSIEHDALARQTAAIDHLGNRTEYEYDANGNQTVVRDALGNETTTVYNALGQPMSVARPDGTSESYQYDASARQTRHTDPAGRTRTTEYDERGNPVAHRIEVPGDPNPVVHTLETLTYDLADRVASRTNADGLTVTYTYDGLGRPLTESYPDGTARTMTYGPAGVLTRTDRLGNTTTYTYDAQGRVATVTDAVGATTTYAYNSVGKRSSITDALNRVTTFSYDAEGRQAVVTHPDGTSDIVAYATGSLVASTTDRTGVVHAYTYDTTGRNTAVSIAGQQVSANTYDELGRVVTRTDAQGVVRTLAYDAMGRLLSTTMPDGSADTFTRGPSGILTSTDRGGATTTYTYDEFGRVALVTDPSNETVSYEYDLIGRRTALVDAKGSRTEWAYDSEGRMTAKTYADNSQLTYTYDAEGRLLTRTDGKGTTVTFSYDANGDLLQVDYPNDTDVTHVYDLLGRRTSVTDALGTTTISYNTAGRVASVDGPLADDMVALTWDATGRRLGTALDGHTVATYTYDGLGRIATASGEPGSFAYSYAGNSGIVAGLSRPGNIVTGKTFDGLGRVTSITHSHPGEAPASTISGFSYTLDDHDRRTRVDLALGGRWDYAYDAVGQLTGGTRSGTTVGGTSGVLGTYGYQYDAMGNPTQRMEDAGVSTYAYDSMNQLATGDWSGTVSAFGWTRTDGLASLTVADANQTVPATVFEPGEWTAKGLDASAGSNTYTVTRTANDATTAQAQTSLTRPAAQTTYTHDANGNMLTHGDWACAWNDENRLAAVTRDDGLLFLEFAYDYQGRRRTKDIYTRDTVNAPFALQSTVSFVYDGWLLLRERTTVQTTWTVTDRTYLHGLDLKGRVAGEGTSQMATAGGIGGMLAVTISGLDTESSLLYLHDANGNVSDLVDPLTEESVAAYEYSPFGKTLVARGPLAVVNPFRFSAKYTDAETGLVYYGYRYYASALGRWLSRDPAEEYGGLLLQGFANNDPVNLIDAHGLIALHISKKFKFLGKDMFFQVFLNGSLWEGDCLSARVRLGVTFPLLDFIRAIVPPPAGEAAARSLEAATYLVNRFLPGFEITLPQIQVYFLGVFKLCRRNCKLCAEKCSLGVGASMTMAITSPLLKFGARMGVAGTYDLCKGGFEASIFYAATIQVPTLGGTWTGPAWVFRRSLSTNWPPPALPQYACGG